MENKQIISACGLVCSECEFFGKQCDGCYAVKGSTFWAQEAMPNKVCPLFDCSINQRDYHSCGNCAELPCDTFLQMKDPNCTEEEHIRMLAVRQEILKQNLS